MSTGREEFELAGSALRQPTGAPEGNAGGSATATRPESPASSALPALSTEEIRNGLSRLDTANEPNLLVLAETLYRSGFFHSKDPDKSLKNASQAVVKILAGREIGLPAVQSMSHLYVVDGKVALEAAAIDVLIHKAGFSYKVRQLDDRACSLEFFKADESLGVSTFSMEDATKAGLTNKGGPWKQYPRNMLRSRALANGARWFCGAALGGVYTREELE